MKLLRAVLPLLVMGMSSCDDPADPLAKARLEIMSGDRQVGAAGAQLAQPVTVRLVDDAGGPMRGIIVDWNVIEGGGYVDSVRTRTDNSGIAQTRWVLGDDVGQHTLLAHTRTASVAVRATANLELASVVGGFRHTCALSTNGQAYCWGANDQNQLGSEAGANSSIPVTIGGRFRFASLSAGWFHTCGVTLSGELLCWGSNSVGQLGSLGGDASAPRRVPLPEAMVSVAAGSQHTCAVGASGAAYCWGSDDKKTLGAGDATIRCPVPGANFCTSLPQRVPTAVLFASISAGEFHTCAIGKDNLGYCWGWNSHGQTGNRAPADALVATPSQITSTREYRVIGSGSRHVCALTTANAPDCWGRNIAGETGLDPSVAVSAPEPMSTTLRFTQIDGGETHTCALGNDQRAYCWGSLLGNGTPATSKTPVAVSLSGTVTSVSAGARHACAVAAAAVWCWGSNSHGQLGVANVTSSNTPVQVQVGR